MKKIPIKLYNTLTRKKEVFKPIKKACLPSGRGRVGMYTCGPTVYGPGHLGHARSYTNFDLLKRAFLYNGYKVKHVLNITDVHDDMIKKASELGISIQELADRYVPLFKKDLADLNVIPADEYPRVLEHISEIIEMVKILIGKGYGYVEKDGSVYFDVSKFKKYGKLSGIKLEEAKTGTRVETDKYEREHVADFALWKGWKEGEPYWESPWGKGRPGWHIECSVMASKYLGKTIDLHAGALDLKFPHHENEIAQSEAANGVKFVNYWFHAGLLEVEGQKMSKSLGNYIEIHEVKEKGFSPLALRYLFLTAHYRSQMNFTWDSLKAAEVALGKLRAAVSEFGTVRSKVTKEQDNKITGYQQDFLGAINDDLNTPQALAVVWEVVKKARRDSDFAPAALKLLLDFDRVLDLRLDEIKPLKITPEVRELVKEREKLREQGKFAEADKVRGKIEEMGFVLEDTEEGTGIKAMKK